MTKLALSAAAVLLLAAGPLSAAFDDDFTGKTLRVDYFHSGIATEEHLSLDRARVEVLVLRGHAAEAELFPCSLDLTLEDGDEVESGGLIEHLLQSHDVLQAIYHPCVGRFAVATRATGFLVIGFQALRQIEVCDKSHVGFVDAHTECNRGDDDDAVLG